MPGWEPVWRSLVYVAEEMGSVLRRTAVSPNIRDRLDFSCAVLDAEGRLVAQAEHIPVHLGVLGYAGRTAVEAASRLGVGPGDVFISNDPYLLGTHLNDVTLLKPVYHSGRLVAWLAVKAHHVDVGGRAPGSIGGAERIEDEGVLVHMEKLVVEGRLVEGIVERLASVSRTPVYLRMDLHAQLAALEWGERLLTRAVDRYGVDRLLEAMGESLRYVERYARSVLSELSGSAEYEDFIEDDERAYRVSARLDAGCGDVRVALEGPPQLPKPVNSTMPSTAAAVAYTLKSILEPDLPVNHGFYAAVKVEAREGSVFNARPPAPVSVYTETVQRIVDLVQGALAKLLPGRVPAASGGSMSNVAIGGEGWAFYETIGCGSGGRPGSDGVDGVHVNMTNTLNTPVELLEEEYPVAVEEYSLRGDSGGLGEYRGGLGLRRVYRMLARARASIAGSRVWTRPWGLEGGEPGARAEYKVVRRDGRVERLPPLALVDLEPGDMLVIETPGGGGYGDPCRRDERLVERDLREGRMSRHRVLLREAECARRGRREQR